MCILYILEDKVEGPYPAKPFYAGRKICTHKLACKLRLYVVHFMVEFIQCLDTFDSEVA